MHYATGNFGGFRQKTGDHNITLYTKLLKSNFTSILELQIKHKYCCFESQKYQNEQQKSITNFKYLNNTIALQARSLVHSQALPIKLLHCIFVNKTAVNLNDYMPLCFTAGTTNSWAII
jgi:hypothetical protein